MSAKCISRLRCPGVGMPWPSALRVSLPNRIRGHSGRDALQIELGMRQKSRSLACVSLRFGGRGCHGALAYRTYPLPIGWLTQL